MSAVDIADASNFRKAPRPFYPLGERFPELRQLRDQLLARIVDFDDLSESYGRLLLNLSAEQPAWSRVDALLKR